MTRKRLSMPIPVLCYNFARARTGGVLAPRERQRKMINAEGAKDFAKDAEERLFVSVIFMACRAASPNAAMAGRAWPEKAQARITKETTEGAAGGRA